MANEYDKMPDELPETPEGFGRELRMHMKMANGVSQASYTVISPDRVRLPFHFAYREEKRHPENNYRGFIIEGHEDKALSWAELRAIWPEWIKKKRKS